MSRLHIAKKALSQSNSTPVRSQSQAHPNAFGSHAKQPGLSVNQLQARPYAVPQLDNSHKTQQEIENEAFQQNKFEATKLGLQAKFGTITSEGQKRLTELKTQIRDVLQRRVEQASRFGHNFAKIASNRPDTLTNTEPNSPFAMQGGSEGERQASLSQPFGAKGPPTPRTPDSWGTHKGAASGRPFSPSDAGGPIRDLSIERLKITSKAVDVVETHTARFGPDAQNAAQIKRLRDIVSGRITAAEEDLNFYAHEMREYVRYRKLNYKTGVPSNPDDAHKLWNDTHTATLEDYGISSSNELYHPSTSEVK